MRLKAIAALALCLVMLAGCGGKSTSTGQQAVVANGGAAAQGGAAQGQVAEVQPEPDAAADNSVVEHEYNDHQLEVDGDIIEIRERLFIAQTNEIYLNYEDYLGRTIRYEGIYMKTEMEEDETYHWVVRYGPGCCGNDGTAGFEVFYDGEYPEQDDWVVVTGVLHYYSINGWHFPYLQIDTIVVLEERGQEFVNT